jgi:ribokinase
VELRRRGPRTVVITLGSEGAVFCDGNKAEWVAPFAVDVVDTTAAGDAFVGALAVRLAEGTALRDAVEFACAAGALTATRPGAQPSLPTRSEVDSLLKHVSRR